MEICKSAPLHDMNFNPITSAERAFILSRLELRREIARHSDDLTIPKKRSLPAMRLKSAAKVATTARPDPYKTRWANMGIYVLQGMFIALMVILVFG